MKKVVSNLIILIIVLIILSFVLISPLILMDDVTLFSDAEEIDIVELNENIASDLNNERIEDGQSELTLNEDISEVAEYKSNRMKNEEYISHTSPDGEDIRDRFDRYNVQCTSVGENLAQTHYDKDVNTEYSDIKNYQSMSELSEGITKQFMNSPEHKENLLRENWDSHGVYTVITDDNEVYVTHKFCQE